MGEKLKFFPFRCCLVGQENRGIEKWWKKSEEKIRCIFVSRSLNIFFPHVDKKIIRDKENYVPFYPYPPILTNSSLSPTLFCTTTISTLWYYFLSRYWFKMLELTSISVMNIGEKEFSWFFSSCAFIHF